MTNGVLEPGLSSSLNISSAGGAEDIEDLARSLVSKHPNRIAKFKNGDVRTVDFFMGPLMKIAQERSISVDPAKLKGRLLHILKQM